MTAEVIKWSHEIGWVHELPLCRLGVLNISIAHNKFHG
jgi:hypothetical protein